jgi:hypothetical protein
MATAAHIEAESGEERSGAYLKGPRELFRENFNRNSFEFGHNLEKHPLFRLDRLMELAKSTQEQRPHDLYYDAGEIDVNQRWDATTKPQFSAADAIQRIENCGAWIALKHAQNDPEYRAVLDQCMAELGELAGLDIDKVMKIQEVIMFVTSPKRVTTYHIDRECSLLLQIQGDKQISVFHRDDRVVLPEEDIERFWTVDNNAPRYNPALQERATVYQLTPGTAVHIPVNFPHWLQNGNNISVSLNINFQYRDAMRANVYRANFLLRRMGLKPTPPFRSAGLDKVKSVAVVPVVWAGNISKGRKPWA